MGKFKKVNLSKILLVLFMIGIVIGIVIAMVCLHSKVNRLSIRQGNIEICLYSGKVPSELATEIPHLLDIISVGVTFFAVFGGLLSVVNIFQSKELYDAIRNAERALKNQDELEAQQLIQIARIYEAKNRPKYAKDYYKEAVYLNPSPLTTCHAKYNIAALNSDVYYWDEEEFKSVCKDLRDLLDDIKKNKIDAKKRELLEGDIYFLLGCIHGKYAIMQADNSYIECSIQYFNKAVKIDRYNVDYHRNLSLSYAIKNDVSKCRDSLKKAKESAEKETLYLSLLTPDTLTKLFKPSVSLYREEIMALLNEWGLDLTSPPP